MRVSRDDEIRFAFQGAGKKLVIGWVFNDSVCFVEVLGDDRLSEDEAEETLDGFLFWLKPLLDPGIVEHSAHLFHDLDGGHQLKLSPDPEVLKLRRERTFPEQAADKEVGIDDSSELTP